MTAKKKAAKKASKKKVAKGNSRKTPISAKTQVLLLSRRRCSICFGLDADINTKKGQIAHLDHDRTNDKIDNLAFLCFEHHDEYDSKTSQAKGFEIAEVKDYRKRLYHWVMDDLDPKTINKDFEDIVTEAISRLKMDSGTSYDPLNQIASELSVSRNELKEVLVSSIKRIKDKNSESVLDTLLAAGEYNRVVEKSQNLQTDLETALSRNEQENLSLKIRIVSVISDRVLALWKKEDAKGALSEARNLINKLDPDLEPRLRISYYRLVAQVADWALDHDFAAASMSSFMKIKKEYSLELDFEDVFIVRNFYLHIGEVEQALGMLSRAFHFIKDLDRSDYRIPLTFHALSLAEQAKDPKKSEMYARKCLGVLQDTGKLEAQAAILGYHALGKSIRLQHESDRIPEALVHLGACEDLCQKLLPEGNSVYRSTRNEIALCCVEVDGFKKAKEIYEECIEMAEKYGARPDELSMYYANLGRVLSLEKDFKGALANFNKAKSLRTQLYAKDHSFVGDLDRLIEECERALSWYH